MKVTIEFGDKTAGTLDISLLGRVRNLPIQRYQYILLDNKRPMETFRGEVDHDFNDGMWVLVQRCIKHAVMSYCLQLSQAQRNRAQCPTCNELVESLYRHDYRVCSCGKTMVDGGREYLRSTRDAMRVPPESVVERRIRLLAAHGAINITLAEAGARFECRTRIGGESYTLYNHSLTALLDEVESRRLDSAVGRKSEGDEYRVRVVAKLIPGATPETAMTDGWYRKTYDVTLRAANGYDACEMALDRFHGEVPIGVLDAVDIESYVVPHKTKKVRRKK